MISDVNTLGERLATEGRDLARNIVEALLATGE
jgi:hypothetical protein